ncbi:MAG: methyltransferase domain-containing protein [Acidobacteria bacterium]|nr:methyltransferase domain-containing protein [Acidobacteriota bacterium]
MKSRLLDYIECLYCHSSLNLTDIVKEDQEIMSGNLVCEKCQRKFPIINGIPRLLPDNLSLDKQETALGFGYSWKAFSHIDPIYEQQFLDWIKPVNKEFFKDKLILDAGCGKGRHCWCSARFEAKEIIGIDLSEAVEVAFLNNRQSANVHIIQADIYNLPFPKQFDYIYSVGVLHHLPDPKGGFLSLIKVLNQGGAISAWVYGRENNWWIIYFLNPIRKNITSKMPRVLLQAFSWSLTFFILYPLVKFIYRPINLLFPNLAKYLFYNDYLFYISKLNFRDIYSIVLDHLIAPTAFYLRQEEFEEWFKLAKLGKVEINWHNRNSWKGLGISS